MQLKEYQKTASRFILDRFQEQPGSGLWLSCGLGKTAVILHTIDTLMEYGQIERAIVVAPARVIATSWPKEIEKWGIERSHKWLNAKDYKADADICFVGCENLALRKTAKPTKVPQLARRLLDADFGKCLLVVDEVTKFKNWSAARTKVLKKLLPKFKHRITMTGSPVPNNLGEVFPQQYILDEGRTLTPYIGHFRDTYMRSCGFENRQWEMRPEMVGSLKAKLAPWYICQEAIDHLDLPELIHNRIEVDLPPKALLAYKQVEKTMFAEFESGNTLTILSGGSRYNACRQMASGCVYIEGEPETVHTAKLEALTDLFEELNGASLLVAYWYKHEGAMLAKQFPKAARIHGGCDPREASKIIDQWQKGKINMILAQAGSVSHGIDGLQHGCNDLCWYTLSDNPDVRHQLEARLYRQGVKGSVRIHYLIAKSTIDSTILRVLNGKAANQAEVIKGIKEISK